MAGKSKAKLEVENIALRGINIYTMITETGRTGLKYGSHVAIAYFVYLSIDALSGKSTDVKADILANLTLGKENRSVHMYIYDCIFMFVVAFFAILYGAVQKKLRSAEIYRLQGRIKDLETIIDSKRKSSGLAENGETNPKDE